MDLVLLGALVWLGAPFGAGQGASNSCAPLDRAFSLEQPLFQSYLQEASNGTCDQTKRHWSYYVLIFVALTGSLVFLCFCSPALKWLISLCFGSNGAAEARSPLRDALCSRSRPRNYGTLSEAVAPRPLGPGPKAARGPAGGRGDQGEGPEVPEEKPGVQTGADLEITLEADAVA